MINLQDRETIREVMTEVMASFSEKPTPVLETRMKPVAMNYRLHVKAGVYESNSLMGLFWEVLKHRFWHWRRGDGWVD